MTIFVISARAPRVSRLPLPLASVLSGRRNGATGYDEPLGDLSLYVQDEFGTTQIVDVGYQLAALARECGRAAERLEAGQSVCLQGRELHGGSTVQGLCLTPSEGALCGVSLIDETRTDDAAQPGLLVMLRSSLISQLLVQAHYARRIAHWEQGAGPRSAQLPPPITARAVGM